MKFLLITDLDNTLVGDEQATLVLNQRLLTLRHNFYLIYATGRSYGSAMQLMAEKQLLEPDYWVTGVGTEIFHQGRRDPLWANKLSQQWNRQAIATLVQSFSDLIPQSPREQNPWKISFCLSKLQNSTILKDLQNQLNQAGLTSQIIFSSGRDVDILPRNADKGLAITYLREQLQIPVKLTLVCGDSGNDISVFQQSTLGTIVSNAPSELIDWYTRYKQPNLYLASSPYAWGILEGLMYFNLLV
jgi:sucrose-6F-phosphate phosphohydrolase